MAAHTGTGARLAGNWHRPRPQPRRDRRRRPIRPAVEALEGRIVLAGSSPANPVPNGLTPGGTPNPQTLGAAYQQVVAIEITTLRSLGDAYREVQAVGAQFASRAGAAIDELNAELRQSQSAHDADAITARIRRDRDLLAVAGADAAREEQGLDVARGVVDQQANTDEIYIPNGLFTTLGELVQQDQSTNSAISRSAQRSESGFVRAINNLGDQLTSTLPVPTSVSDSQNTRPG